MAADCEQRLAKHKREQSDEACPFRRLQGLRPLARLSLITTRASIQNALKRATDPVTKAHLMDATALIDLALDPRGSTRSAQL